LAPPLPAAIQLVVRRLRETPLEHSRMRSLRQIAGLRERRKQVHEMMHASKEEAPSYTANMMKRLGNLVNEADELIPVNVEAGVQAETD
jgi:hypothetical protein